MAQFRKSILSVGTHHSPDGEVRITPARLRHWADTFARMKEAGSVIPVDWDHAQDVEQAVPLSLADYDRRRSAKNTVGKLSDFQVAVDGQSAELTIDVEKSDAADSAEKNLVYVSPVIFPQWRDGAGNEFADCITHVDFVNHPVDQTQGPFTPAEPGAIACAIRMGLSTPYRMASDMSDDPTKDSDDDEPKGDEPASDVPAVPENPDLPSDPTAANQQMETILAHLQKMGIRLPADTTTDNFMERFLPALMTAVEMEQQEEAEQPEEESVPETPTVADPAIATMSLQARSAVAYAERMHRERIAADLMQLLKAGRCTPAEARDKQAAVGAVRLALDKQGNPAASKVEEWIESRKAIPQGTFWTAEQKTRMSAQPATPPHEWDYTTAGRETEEQAEAAADFVAGKR